jgi:hypothetical protein
VIKELISSEKLFNKNQRNIEFYSAGESFSYDDLNLWKILMNKKVKIFKQKNIEFTKVRGKSDKNFFKIDLR